MTTPEPQSPASTLRRDGLDRYIGRYAAELADVLAVPTPDVTGAHHPIAHGRVHDAVVGHLDPARVRETFHALYRGGDRYIGLAITDLPGAAEGRQTVVGWFNSHDRSHAATLLFGERVFVCFNLVLAAEVKIARKHTRHMERDLPGLVADGFALLESHRRDQAQRLQAYRATSLTEPAAHDLLIRLLDEAVFPVSLLPAVLREWRCPSVPALAEVHDVDRLYEAVTWQPQPLATMARRHARLHAVLDAHCGLRGGGAA